MNSPASTCLAINGERLLQRIAQLAQIGAIDGGGVCRLALTDEDKAGRDQVVSWMRDLGMSVEIDQIGNIIGTRAGRLDVAPVMTGSHIDTVRTGGRYDGNLGVLAGLEVVAVSSALRSSSTATTQTRIGLRCGRYMSAAPAARRTRALALVK